MSIEPIHSLLNHEPTFQIQEMITHPSLFKQLVEQLQQTNHTLNEAEKAVQSLAAGQTKSLHQTMLTLEQAKLSFQFAQQIRNRLVGAYQELIREQI
jgi:flagellar hook-basal body complex protein FliE